MASIVIIGGGFAGVWAAASAARLRRDTEGADYDITLVSMTDDMVIRPRLYEARPHEMKVALADVLDPIDVQRVRAKVNAIDTSGCTITATDEHGDTVELDYDRLVVASGSQVVKPTLDGAEHLFDIDTIEAATRTRRTSRRARPAWRRQRPLHDRRRRCRVHRARDRHRDRRPRVGHRTRRTRTCRARRA